MVFVDTDVMVDILRGYPPATEWLASLADDAVVLSGFVYAELLHVLGLKAVEPYDRT